MLQFLPPRVPPPESISVAVHGGGLGKCNIAGVPPCNAHVTFFTSPQTPIFLGGYKNVIMYVTFFTPWGGGQGRQEGSDYTVTQPYMLRRSILISGVSFSVLWTLCNHGCQRFFGVPQCRPSQYIPIPVPHGSHWQIICQKKHPMRAISNFN